MEQFRTGRFRVPGHGLALSGMALAFASLLACGGPGEAPAPAETPAAAEATPPETTQAGASSKLLGVNWELAAWDLRAPVQAGPGGTPTLTLEGQEAEPGNNDADSLRIGGFSGCNRYFAAVEELSEANLVLGPVGLTRMACSEGAMETESRFMKLLAGVTGYGIQEGEFTLTWAVDGKTGVMTFRQGE